MSQHPFPIYRIVAVLVVVLLSNIDFEAKVSLTPLALAQSAGQEQERSSSGRETRRVAIPSTRASKIFQESQEALELERYGDAIALLNQVINAPSKFKSVDIAIALKFRGYAHAQDGALNDALSDFEKAISDPSFPEWDVLALRFTMAQIYLAEGRVTEAITSIEQWFARAEAPTAPAYFFAAQAFAQADRWVDAQRYVELGLTKIGSESPNENWYRIATVVYLQNQEYSQARPLLEKMISLWPGKKEYYSQLGAVYSELGREKDSFAMLAMAYDNHLDLNSGELVRLGQLYRMYEYPFRAAKIIEKAIDDGKLRRNQKNCEEWGNAYFQAREMKEALGPLECAAKASNNGEIWLRICQVHLQQDAWSRAESACREAIAKGGLQRYDGRAEQYRGIALYEQGKRKEAIKMFEACAAKEESADICVRRKNLAQVEAIRERLEKERLDASAQSRAERQAEIERQIRQIEQDAKKLK